MLLKPILSSLRKRSADVSFFKRKDTCQKKTKVQRKKHLEIVVGVIPNLITRISDFRTTVLSYFGATARKIYQIDWEFAQTVEF